MGNLIFAPAVSVKDQLKKYTRDIEKAAFTMQFEMEEIARQEAALQKEIPLLYKQGKSELGKCKARELVRKRGTMVRFARCKAQLETVCENLQVASATTEMTAALRGAARTIYLLNRQIPLDSLRAIMEDYQGELEAMDEKQEAMDATLDEAIKNPEEQAAQEDALVQQVLDELAVEQFQQLPDTKAAGVPTAVNQEDLLRRLERLRAKQSDDNK